MSAKKTVFFAIFLIFISFFCFSEEILCESFTQIDENKTEIIIESSVPKAYVYINGQLQGRTALKIKNLRNGLYNLKLKKKNFEDVSYEFTVKNGMSQRFYIELKPVKPNDDDKADSSEDASSTEATEATEATETPPSLSENETSL